MLINANRKQAAGDGAATENLDPRVELREEGGRSICRLCRQLDDAQGRADRRGDARDRGAQRFRRSLVVDLSDVGRMDTAGAWLIERLVSAARAKGVETRDRGAERGATILLGAVGDAARAKAAIALRRVPNSSS